jgi:hypothetical protein
MPINIVSSSCYDSISERRLYPKLRRRVPQHAWKCVCERGSCESKIIAFIVSLQRTLSTPDSTLDKDFVLVVTTASSEDENVPDLLAPRALIESCHQFPGVSAMQVAFTPRDLLPLGEISPNINVEIILLVDLSGSMDPNMKALRQALQLFIQNLHDECLFNVCVFSSTFASMWQHCKPITTQTTSEVLGYISRLKANMGGTEISKALQRTVDQKGKSCSTQVVVFADGAIWNMREVNNYIITAKASYGDELRFFALGIGDQMSHELIEGIAKYGGGFAETVGTDPSERWDDRVKRMLEGIRTSSD